MNIINHPLCTATIGAPSDMQDDCSALPVAYHTDEHGTWAVSFWKPEADELATLAADGGITLQVRAPGRQHPVVAMGVYPSISPVPQARAAISAALANSKQSRTLEAPLPAASKPLCLSKFASLGDYLMATVAAQTQACEPVAWAVLAENGNCRIWFGDKKSAIKWAETNSSTLTPLFATAPVEVRPPAEINTSAVCTCPSGDGSLAWPCPQHCGGTRAANDVVAERRRQREVEGWTESHDDNYRVKQLRFAAASYTLGSNPKRPPATWPWSPRWWKPRDPRSNLVRAGALILAEIERMDRAASAQEAPAT